MKLLVSPLSGRGGSSDQSTTYQYNISITCNLLKISKAADGVTAGLPIRLEPQQRTNGRVAL